MPIRDSADWPTVCVMQSTTLARFGNIGFLNAPSCLHRRNRNALLGRHLFHHRVGCSRTRVRRDCRRCRGHRQNSVLRLLDPVRRRLADGPAYTGVMIACDGPPPPETAKRSRNHFLITQAAIVSSHNYDEKYTKPDLRRKLKRDLTDNDKGGRPGQWSA